MQCNAPVVPVAQFGTSAVQPIGAMWPKFFRPVEVKVGAPMRWERAVTGRRELRQFTDEIMVAIAALSGQEMVPEYAQRDKGRLSAPGSEAEPAPARRAGSPGVTAPTPGGNSGFIWAR